MFKDFATFGDMSPETRAKYQHCGLVPEFPATPVEEVQRRGSGGCSDRDASDSEGSKFVNSTWVRKDYKTSRFVIIDRSQAVKGAPRWNQVFRRDAFSLPDNRLIQRINISGKNRRKRTISGLLPCGCSDTMTVFLFPN